MRPYGTVQYRTVRGHRYIFILSGYLHRMDCIIALILLLCDIHLLSLCTHPAAIGPSQLPLISQASCIFRFFLAPPIPDSRLAIGLCLRTNLCYSCPWKLTRPRQAETTGGVCLLAEMNAASPFMFAATSEALVRDLYKLYRPSRAGQICMIKCLYPRLHRVGLPVRTTVLTSAADSRWLLS